MAKSRGMRNRGNDADDSIDGLGKSMIVSSLLRMFGIRSIVRCDADDESIYCQFTKIMSVVFTFIYLLIFLVIIFIALGYFGVFGKKNSRSNSGFNFLSMF